MEIKDLIKRDLEDLKTLINRTMNLYYGKSGLDLIKGFKTSKNGLFVYGKEVECRGQYQGHKYRIEFYISWYDCNYYEHIKNTIDMFVIDNKRLGK